MPRSKSLKTGFIPGDYVEILTNEGGIRDGLLVSLGAEGPVIRPTTQMCASFNSQQPNLPPLTPDHIVLIPWGNVRAIAYATEVDGATYALNAPPCEPNAE